MSRKPRSTLWIWPVVLVLGLSVAFADGVEQPLVGAPRQPLADAPGPAPLARRKTGATGPLKPHAAALQRGRPSPPAPRSERGPRQSQAAIRLVVGRQAAQLGAQVDGHALVGQSNSLTQTIAQDRDAVEFIQLGEAELAVVATPLSLRNRHNGLQAELLGAELFVVVAPPSSPLRDISSAQLRQLLTGTTTNWSAFGLPATPVLLVVPSDRQLVERAQRALINGDRFSSSARTVAGDRGVFDLVVREPGAIGVVRLASLDIDRNVHALGIDGVLPTMNSFAQGGYPFGTPLLLVTRGPLRGAAADVLRLARTGAIPFTAGVTRAL